MPLSTATTFIPATLTDEFIFSERELLSPVRLSSVTFVRHTRAVQIFGNISMALGTLAIH